MTMTSRRNPPRAAHAVVALAAALLAGCVTTTERDVVNVNDERWLLEGKYNQTAASADLFINGEQVIDGALSAWDLSGTTHGEYRGHKVTLACGSLDWWHGSLRCDVLVNGQFYEQLKFDGCGAFGC